MNLTNRTTDASCFIFSIEQITGTETASMEIWSDRKVEEGVKIDSSQQVSMYNENQTNITRSWEVVSITSQRDNKGQWKEDNEKKNKNTRYSLIVKPR